MVDLHDRLEAAAARPAHDAPLAQLEHRLQRRRRLRVGGIAAASALCLGAVGGGIALATSDGGGRVSTTRPASSAESATLTVALPEGWVESPLDPAVTPLEIVRVGTRTLPPLQAYATPEELCSLLISSDDAYVIVGDYFTEPTPTPGEELPPRGDSFISMHPFGANDCATGTAVSPAEGGGPLPLVPGRVAHYLFSESGRDLRALVGIGTAADDARRDELFAVLDSLEIAPARMTVEPAPPSTTGNPTAPTAPERRPETMSADEDQITAAFVGWLDADTPDLAVPFVEDGPALRDTIAAAAATNSNVLRYSGSVDSIRVTGPDRADVGYTILFDGSPALIRRGEAVKIGGVWMVSRETVCELEELAPGVRCPPRQS